MAQKVKGSKFHPARISGIQKQMREREANARIPKQKESYLIPADDYFKK